MLIANRYAHGGLGNSKKGEAIKLLRRSIESSVAMARPP